MFDNAISIYKEAVALTEESDIELKSELVALECSLFSNIAVCYKQMQNGEGETEFCSKVLGHSESLLLSGHSHLVIKAHLRRGFVYERDERFKKAFADFEQVRKLDPYNVENSKALKRCQEALNHLEIEKKS